jgi:hypothetical protein
MGRQGGGSLIQAEILRQNVIGVKV